MMEWCKDVRVDGSEEKGEGYTTYECLRVGRPSGDLAAEATDCFCFSSRWTAVENRFQKLGSWTRAIFVVID